MYAKKGTFYAGVALFLAVSWSVGTARLNLELYRYLVMTLVGGCVMGVIGMGIVGYRTKKF